MICFFTLVTEPYLGRGPVHGESFLGFKQGPVFAIRSMYSGLSFETGHSLDFDWAMGLDLISDLRLIHGHGLL